MLGAGGHARVLQEALALGGTALHGFIAPDSSTRLDDVTHLGGDEALAGLDPAAVVLVNGVGSVRAAAARQAVHERAAAAGFRFLTVVDPTAIVRPSATLGAGSQVLAGAIVNTGAVVGDDAVINSGAIVEHDARVGAHAHLSPGAVLAGDVVVGDRSHIGLGARVLQGVAIGTDCTIAAGAVVTRNIEDGMTAIGVPAVARPTR